MLEVLDSYEIVIDGLVGILLVFFIPCNLLSIEIYLNYNNPIA
ncbi:unnamed protein product [Camellia sinensis]